MKKIKDMLKKHKKIAIAIVLILIPILLELITTTQLTVNKEFVIRMVIRYGLEFLVVFYFVCCKYQEIVKKVLNYIIQKRFIIIVIVFIIGVLCKINFASINIWARYLNEDGGAKNILGISRGIRSDEWLVQSTYFLAQTKNEDGYTERNDHIMQGNFNVLMNSGPVLDLCTISKPLIWGFLLFGTDYGFSWWWMLRIILLLLVSFEVMRIITKKDNLLSITGMFVLALAPGLMWWFSTAIIDSYIWGMAIIVLFNYYMENLNYNIKKKIGIAIGMLISIPAFAFALYPAYQVPLAFVVIIFMLNDIIKHWKELKKKDYIIMGVTLAGAVGILAYFVINAWPDIQVMMSTVYPGDRFDVGGDYTIDRFVSIFTNIFLPYGNKIDNPCEISGYIYPITGLVILIIRYFAGNKEKDKKESKNNFLEIALIALYAVLFTWVFIGFNKFFAKITFLYFSPSQRAKLVLELIGILLIFMLLKRFEGKPIVNRKQGVVISVIVLLIVEILIKNSTYKSFFSEIKIEILFFMIFVLTYTLIRANKKAFCYSMCIVAILAGAAINPIASGTDIFYNTNISKQIQEIYQSDKEALWIGRYNWSGQYLAANGVNILNGVNIYPNFNWLKIVDPEGKYDEVYNRYAHIGIILSDKTEFTLLTQDSYEVRLTYQNIKDLNVKYYFTDTKLSDEIQEEFHTEVKFEDQEKNQYIYQFN